MAEKVKTLFRDGIDQGLVRLDFGQSAARINADSRTYWTNTQGEAWAANSHWRSEFTEGDWSDIVLEH